MKYGNRLFALACALFLAACATPYQKNGLGGGFGEKKISDSAYWVYFSGNGYASQVRVVNFWLYRCAELTIEKGYQYMVIRPGENPPAPSGQLENSAVPPVAQAGRPRLATVAYIGSEPPVMLAKGGGTVHTYTYTTSSIRMWSSKGTVLMYHSPLGEELVWALDANKVLEDLGPYVRSGGQAPSPGLETIVHDAMVAHEQVLFGGDNAVVGVEEPTRADESAGKSPRSKEEIEQQFQSESIPFHSLFREREHVEHHSNAGTVVLSFVVTPNGTVTDCRVVSTTFSGSQLPAALATLACRMVFPPKDVAGTAVRSFPVTFAPVERRS